MLARLADDVDSLALDGDYVYALSRQRYGGAALDEVTSWSRLWRVPRAGGAAQEIAVGHLSAPRLVGVDATHVDLFVSSAPGSASNATLAVARVPKGGGPISTERTSLAPDSFPSPVVDDAYLYWYDGHHAIARAPLAAADATTAKVQVVAGVDPLALAVDGDAVFWTDRSGAVERAPKRGGAAQAVTRTGSNPDGLVAGEGWLVWGWQSDSDRSRVLWSAPQTGGDGNMVSDAYGTGAAIHAGNVFYVQYVRHLRRGRLKVSPLGDDDERTVADPAGGACIVGNAVSIAWCDDAQIMTCD